MQSAVRNPDVSDMVERELSARPTFSHRVLQTLAAELDSTIGVLDPRLFHAEYVVPAQRRIAAVKDLDRKRGRKTKRGGSTRSKRRQGNGAEGARSASQAADELASGAAEASPPVQVEAAAEAATEAPAPADASGPAARRAGAATPAVSRDPARRRETREPVRESHETRGRARVQAARSPERIQAVRAAFFAWARALADADSPAAIVDVFDQVDRYVDAALEA